MSVTGFWGVIEAQLRELTQAKTVDDVFRILSTERDPYTTVLGDSEHRTSTKAFFAGGGGDERVEDALHEAGWRLIWRDAWYYWAMRSPTGGAITYTEGDIYHGDTRAIGKARSGARVACRNCGLGGRYVLSEPPAGHVTIRGDRDVEPCPDSDDDFHHWEDM